MTITQLEYIIALETHHNFAKAAEHCFVTQPTLSMQIKKLEDELGVVLFDRNKKPVAPTDIGALVIEEAQRTLHSLQKIQEVVQQHADEVSGKLRIGIIPTLSPYLLPRLLPKLADKYPKIEFEIEELLSEQLVDKLHKDQLDLGIWVANRQEPHLLHASLFYEKFLIYLPEGHPYPNTPIALQELDMNHIWLLKEGHCFRDQVQKLCSNLTHTRHQVNFLSGSLETLKKMVDQHYGFTLLPELAIRELSEKQKENVREFKHIQPLREVSLTYHKRFPREKLIRIIKKEVQESVPAELLDEQRGNVIPWK
uniref:LysR substrate-binding domain-containing protein n=1 Tax=Roseihalotalea indica TaxID=2867963 RepID=A0AA49GUX0_9BACT|nr:LysR substrate-binding domain-containing protein [Tunicatimonas sp. TK19036]